MTKNLKIKISTILSKISLSLPVHFLGLLFSLIVSIYVSRNFGASGTGILSLSRLIVEFSVLLTLLGTAPTYLIKMVSQQIALG